jgi:hypothetical protein
LNVEESNFRSGTKYKDPFPESQKGTFNYELLKHMEITKEKMLKHDTFFFWQLLFLIFVTPKSLALQMIQGSRST